MSDGRLQSSLVALYSGFQTLVIRPELRRPFVDVPPYFRALVGKHAIFNRLDGTDEVVVVRILHATMLPELHLLIDDQS